MPYDPSVSNGIARATDPESARKKTKVKAILSFVFAALAIIFDYISLTIPGLWLFGIVLSITGIVFGQQSKKNIQKEHEDYIIAKWGVIASRLALIISCLIPIFKLMILIYNILILGRDIADAIRQVDDDIKGVGKHINGWWETLKEWWETIKGWWKK